MITIDNIKKSFDGKTILSGVDGTIKTGEIFAIIGPSGQGKTTLLRILNLLETPSEGNIILDGVSIHEIKDRNQIRRKMGMVFQDTIAFHDTVFNNIALGLRYRHYSKKEIQERVMQKLGEIGLSGFSNRNATTLSGGEKQRVSLARVLITDPEILLLDEPTANLDPISTEVIENLIRRYNRECNTTVIMATHDLLLGQRLADRVAVMMDGRFIQSGTVFDLFSRPCSGAVAQFIGIGNILTGTVIGNKDGMAVIETDGVRVYALGEIPPQTPVTIAIRPEEITLHRGSDTGTSARNVITGIIESVQPFGIISTIRVSHNTFRLSVQVTWQSMQDLNLAPGIPVTISFKASSVHGMPDECSHAA
ncbi:MAG: ABC transporter ATP-binding protein [Methanospirillaceae archaeon]|nr:ABC transporter ATP-binding protein [Methanospirillaceae archaeon]